jgi:hypothetical protein
MLHMDKHSASSLVADIRHAHQRSYLAAGDDPPSWTRAANIHKTDSAAGTPAGGLLHLNDLCVTSILTHLCNFLPLAALCCRRSLVWSPCALQERMAMLLLQWRRRRATRPTAALAGLTY